MTVGNKLDTVGSRLRLKREELRLRQADIAEAIGKNKQLISKYETGALELDYQSLEKLNDHFGWDINWLITGKSAIPENQSITSIDDLKAIVLKGLPEGIGENGGVNVPLIAQKVSAGHGQEIFDDSDLIIGYVSLAARIARRYPGWKIFAMEVTGDSMINSKIDDGDIAFGAYQMIRGNGIYFIDVDGAFLIKRVEFNYFTKELIISSDNEKYPEVMRVPMESETVRIVGLMIHNLHGMVNFNI